MPHPEDTPEMNNIREEIQQLNQQIELMGAQHILAASKKTLKQLTKRKQSSQRSKQQNKNRLKRQRRNLKTALARNLQTSSRR